MDNQKPLTAEEIAKLKKNGKTMLAVAAAVFVLVMILTIAGSGAPTWMLIIVGMAIGFGIMELRKAKKAETQPDANVPVTHQVIEDTTATPVIPAAPLTPEPVTPPSEPQA